MVDFFINDYKLPNVPIFESEEIENDKIPKYYKIFFENKASWQFIICIPSCCRRKKIIFQTPIFEP